MKEGKGAVKEVIKAPNSARGDKDKAREIAELERKIANEEIIQAEEWLRKQHQLVDAELEKLTSQIYFKANGSIDFDNVTLVDSRMEEYLSKSQDMKKDGGFRRSEDKSHLNGYY